jgi:hypothetical protein
LSFEELAEAGAEFAVAQRTTPDMNGTYTNFIPYRVNRGTTKSRAVAVRFCIFSSGRHIASLDGFNDLTVL